MEGSFRDELNNMIIVLHKWVAIVRLNYQGNNCQTLDQSMLCQLIARLIWNLINVESESSLSSTYMRLK